MKHLYYTLLAAGTLSLAACTSNYSIENELNMDQNIPTQQPVMGAVNGEIFVKINPSVLEGIENYTASATRSVGRAGVSAFDEALGNIGAYSFERIFPIDAQNEARTREAGLHQWYVVRFDEVVELEKAYAELAKLSGVSAIQYSHAIQRGYQAKKATIVSQEARSTMQARTLPFNDPRLGEQWGYINTGEANNGLLHAVAGMDVNCAEAWTMSTGDESIIVAVLDEGVMYDHVDLAPNMWKNPKEAWGSKEDLDGNGYVGDVYGYNFVMDTPYITYNDVNDTGHGTHVAGTIAAVNNNGIGVGGVAGGDFANGVGGVKIMSCQIFAGNSGVTLYNEARAIKYAADNGAVILQCSWGYNSALANPSMFYPGPATDSEWAGTYPLEKEALDYFINYAGSPNGVIQGGLAIFASGNESGAMAAYPSAYNECVSVSSLDAAGLPSNFTNYGDRIKISAPGGDVDFHQDARGKILSTVPALGESLDKSAYGYMEGTSMACPTVSGVAALGLSYAVQQRRHFKAAEFRELMYASCTPIEPYFTDTKYYWDLFEYYGQSTLLSMQPAAYRGKMGHGLIDAGALLARIGGGAGIDMRVPNTTVSLNGTVTVDFAPYFLAGEGLTYTATIGDESVATITVSGTTATVTGVKTGSVKATVTASNGKVQEFIITVRNQAGNNGWM
ncbi:MAG: S8 family serine peptidase [Phocaeicola sp.]